MTDTSPRYRVAFLVANEGVEQAELEQPWEAIIADGGRPELLAPNAGVVHAMRHLDHGDDFTAGRAIRDAVPDDYDGVVLPGGVANPDQLRDDEDAVGFLRQMFAAEKPVAAICHAPWTLINAGVLAGRVLTSWPSLRLDVTNAGATWTDEEVHVCANGPNLLVTSRKPDDLPAFCRTLVQTMRATGIHGTDREVDEAGEESFPASDPPASNARAD